MGSELGPRETHRHATRAGEEALVLGGPSASCGSPGSSRRTKRVLGSEEKARHWMLKPSRALTGAIPLGLLDTDIGANAVFDELGRIEHGVFV